VSLRSSWMQLLTLPPTSDTFSVTLRPTADDRLFEPRPLQGGAYEAEYDHHGGGMAVMDTWTFDVEEGGPPTWSSVNGNDERSHDPAETSEVVWPTG
jgi:hypothetical protein